MKQQFMNKCALDAGGVAAKLGYMKFENFAEDDLQFVIANVYIYTCLTHKFFWEHDFISASETEQYLPSTSTEAIEPECQYPISEITEALTAINQQYH
ncbi:hypothetical protein EB796_003997 [Bugula neritina]|uniref:Uncharacterized protein n=1 Tax=Bugula neritina TaxID=10212 RepID=A0A7J7KGI0_BUGNE|nr:hypothetical protein EB796_003997 [Bugula neritina]